MFALRIDIDTRKGLQNGVPKILDLLKKYRLKASFYCVMGGESGLFELLKYRNKIDAERSSNIKLFTKPEIFRMVLFPKNFAEENKVILQRIIKEGHELGAHGWKHRKWTRALDQIDLDSEFGKIVRKYKEIIGTEPKSFVAPAFKTNNKVLLALDKYNFTYAGDLPGNKPFRPIVNGKKLKHVQVPVTIKGPNNTPLIEHMVSVGKSDDRILDELKLQIKKNKYAVLYVHDIFECDQKIELLEKLFQFLVKSKTKVVSVENMANSVKI